MNDRSSAAFAAIVVAAGVAGAITNLRGGSTRSRRATGRASPDNIAELYRPRPGHMRVIAAGRTADAPAGSAPLVRALLEAADEHDILPAPVLARLGVRSRSSMHLRAVLRQIGAHLVTREAARP